MTRRNSRIWVGNTQAQRILGISDFTVRAWADKGYLLYKRTPGGHRRFRLDALLELRDLVDGAPEPEPKTTTTPDPGA
jgi:excisionase family DNA binding protein